MYSSEDLERFYFQYQTEALPHGESLQSFCVKNKVPYNIFQKWYRDTRKKVVEVQVDGAPVIGHEEQSGAIDQPQPVSPGRCHSEPDGRKGRTGLCADPLGRGCVKRKRHL